MALKTFNINIQSFNTHWNDTKYCTINHTNILLHILIICTQFKELCMQGLRLIRAEPEFL